MGLCLKVVDGSFFFEGFLEFWCLYSIFLAGSVWGGWSVVFWCILEASGVSIFLVWRFFWFLSVALQGGLVFLVLRLFWLLRRWTIRWPGSFSGGGIPELAFEGFCLSGEGFWLLFGRMGCWFLDVQVFWLMGPDTYGVWVLV